LCVLLDSKILLEAWYTLPEKVKGLVSAADVEFKLENISRGEEREFTVAEALVLTAVFSYCQKLVADMAVAARPKSNTSQSRMAIKRVVDASKTRTKFGDLSAASVRQFLKWPLLSGGTLPRLQKAKKGETRAVPASEAAAAALAVLPRASAKSPIDLDGGDGNERAAKKPYDILHEASYAIDAPAGDRRVLARNIAMHNEELAQQAAALELTRTLRKSAAEQERLELARTLRESAMEQDRFECAEALVLAQATRESEAEYARFERDTFREFDADPSGEMDRDEFYSFFSSFVGGGGENVSGSDDLEDVFGYSDSLEVCVCCSLRGRMP